MPRLIPGFVFLVALLFGSAVGSTTKIEPAHAAPAADIAAYVHGLLLSGFKPGRSKFSLELLDACEPDPKVSCSVHPVCPQDMGACADPDGRERPCCAVPRWVDGLGWVRTETRDAGAERLRVVAQALADAALLEGERWLEPGGSQDLARAMVAAFGYSTGFREDIQTGRLRGPGGEICLSDLRISTLRRFVAEDLRDLPEDELVGLVAGRDYQSLRRCLDAGARAMVESRRVAGWKCDAKGRPKLLSTFAIYGTGRYCRTAEAVGKNLKTFEEHREIIIGLERKKYLAVLAYRARGEHPIFPDWYRRP